VGAFFSHEVLPSESPAPWDFMSARKRSLVGSISGMGPRPLEVSLPSDTTVPGAKDSATMRPFSALLQRRRRPTPLRISTRPRGGEASTICSTIYANRSHQQGFASSQLCRSPQDGMKTPLTVGRHRGKSHIAPVLPCNASAGAKGRWACRVHPKQPKKSIIGDGDLLISGIFGMKRVIGGSRTMTSYYDRRWRSARAEHFSAPQQAERQDCQKVQEHSSS
jgi:hypothetical protein